MSNELYVLSVYFMDATNGSHHQLNLTSHNTVNKMDMFSSATCRHYKYININFRLVPYVEMQCVFLERYSCK